MSDDFAVAAEFYDLWFCEQWKQTGPELSNLLGDVDATTGPVLDLGAGTGLATLTVADAVQDASIVAVELARAMRAVLFSRVMSRPDLRSRVTIAPAASGELLWPAQIGGFVAMAMLGHLGPDERIVLWNRLGEHLAPGAPAIVQLQPPARPERVPLVRHTVVDLGDHTYEGWSKGEPAGDRLVLWSLRYVVRNGDRVIDDQHWTSEFQTVSIDDVTAEAGAVGFTVATPPSTPSGLVALRRHRSHAVGDFTRP